MCQDSCWALGIKYSPYLKATQTRQRKQYAHKSVTAGRLGEGPCVRCLYALAPLSLQPNKLNTHEPILRRPCPALCRCNLTGPGLRLQCRPLPSCSGLLGTHRERCLREPARDTHMQSGRAVVSTCGSTFHYPGQTTLRCIS